MGEPLTVSELLEKAEEAFLLVSHIATPQFPESVLHYVDGGFAVVPFFEGSAYLPPLEQNDVTEWNRRVISISRAEELLVELENALVKRYALNPQEVALRSFRRVLFTWEFLVTHLGAWVVLMTTIGQQALGLLSKTGNTIGRLIYLWWEGQTDFLSPVLDWRDGEAKDLLHELGGAFSETAEKAWDYIELMVVASMNPLVQVFATEEALTGLIRPCVEEGWRARQDAMRAALPQRKRIALRRRRRSRG